MAFRKTASAASTAKPANPAVIGLQAQRAKTLKDIDRQLSAARRVAQQASAELSRARHAVNLLEDNKRTMLDTLDALIAAAEAESAK